MLFGADIASVSVLRLAFICMGTTGTVPNVPALEFANAAMQVQIPNTIANYNCRS